MNIVFIGPPYAGKGTQTTLLGGVLRIPVYSMGELIRQAYYTKDPRAVKGFEEYSMKGLHLPNELKFPFLEEKLAASPNGFIIDNYPATVEDLATLLDYLRKHDLKIDKAFHMVISVEEMEKRMAARGRKDDHPEVISARRFIQDKDRMPVITHFRSQGLLEEINGIGTIEGIHQDIIKRLSL